MIATWQAPLESGKDSEELLLSFDEGRDRRILILPALFDEANKMRRFTVQLMRRLNSAEVDCFLPDLPGCNDSLSPLSEQTLASWRSAVDAAAKQFGVTHFLSVRAGALIAPASLPGWHYAPQTGAKLLRGMMRAKIIAEREAGRDTSSDQMLTVGRSQGIELNGWFIGSAMLNQLETAEPVVGERITSVEQKALGGAGLWLRAEPDQDNAQSDALASIVLETLVTQS